MKTRTPILACAISTTLLLLSSCITWNSGLQPEKPKYGYMWTADVDTLTPDLAWKAYRPEKQDQTNIRYQLEVLKDRETVVYSRDSIPENHHILEHPLQPGRLYHWHVRPVYDINGETERGAWNGKGFFWFAVYLFGFGQANYMIKTPKAEARHNKPPTENPDQPRPKA